MYEKVAQEYEATVIPAGPGWQLARELRPQVELYTDDGSHPNDLGTYLTACIFVGKLTGDYPVNLPLRYYTRDLYGESIELLRMEAFDIQFCMSIAREVVEKFK